MPLSPGQTIQINDNGEVLQITSVQKGSRPGGFCKNENEAGKAYYLKYAPLNPANKHQFQNELLAFKLYQLFEVNVPNANLVQFEHEGQNYIGILTDRVNIQTVKEANLQKNDEFKKAVIQDFLIDTFLANEDVAGSEYNNLCVTDEKPLRLDLDAVLLYNSRGVQRGQLFNEQAVEFETLLDPKNINVNEPSRDIFKLVFSIYKTLSIIAGLRKLLSISDERLVDCVRKNGFDSQQENDQLINILKKRREALIAKAEEQIFNHQIIIDPRIPAQDRNEDRRGRVHASRVALHAEHLINLLRDLNYKPAQNLTEKDLFLIKMGIFFQDCVRVNSKPEEWHLILEEAGFSNEDIESLIQAIHQKSNFVLSEDNIYALILAVAEILDECPFDIKKLPDIIKKTIPENALLELAKTAKAVAVEQGDSPRDQFDLKRNDDVNHKNRYKNHKDGCYIATKKLYQQIKNNLQMSNSSVEGSSGKGKNKVEAESGSILMPVLPPKFPENELQLLKSQIHNKMHEYISSWKCSFFGHHHNQRALAVLQAIEDPKTDFNQICNIINNQLKLFEEHIDANKIPEVNPTLLEARWSKELHNFKQDFNTSGYYSKIKVIKGELLSIHEKEVAQSMPSMGSSPK